MTSPQPKRSFLQFSLQTLFVLMTAFAIWFGWAMNKASVQKKAVEWVREMGGTVRYEYDVDETFQTIKDAKRPVRNGCGMFLELTSWMMWLT